jgi:8-amino-7-oxononanoate synthase
MESSLTEFISQRITRQAEAGLRRELKIPSETLIDFSSNDYLGLARSENLSRMIAHEWEHLNEKNLNGSSGSRLLTGNSAYTVETEKTLASIFKAEAGLLCNSGYSANLAVLSAVPQKGDTILYDELAHASIKDGARLSLANRFSFRHNDVDDLHSKVVRANGRIFIVVESIYSMDGDRSPLKEISLMAAKYGCTVILDEAHSTGMYTSTGAGLAVKDDLSEFIDIRIYTFGKAAGVHGAFVAGKKTLADYLINFSRPFIYTTSLPPHSVISIRCAFKYLEQRPDLFQNLQRNIAAYLASSAGLTDSRRNDTAIQTVIIPGNENVRRASQYLANKGFDVCPILSPTVPAGKERLRICLHSFNDLTEIENLSIDLKQFQTTGEVV